MHPRQEFDRRLLVLLQYSHFVSVPSHLQTGISFPSVRVDHAARLDRLGDKGLQTGGRGVPNLTQSDAPGALSVFLAGHSHQSLCLCPATANPLFQSAQVSLVHLDPTAQLVTARSHHGPSQFVQPCPGGDVAAQTQNALQPQRTGSVLLRRHPPDSPEPQGQRFPGILEDRTRRQRHLVFAASTDQQVTLRCPTRRPATARANETFRPTKLQQVLSTGLFGSKPGLQFSQRAGVVLHRSLPQHIGQLESTKYPEKGVLIAAMIVVLALGWLMRSRAATLKPGDRAPDFTLPDQNG